MRKALSSTLALLAVVAAVAVLAGCDTPQNTFSPKSDLADGIMGLYALVTWLAAIVGALVLLAMLYLMIRYRARPGVKPKQIHGNTILEIIWTVGPILVLVAIAVPTMFGIANAARSTDEETLHVTAVGHQWWFEFRYPGLGPDGADLVTANEMHVPIGRRVQVHLESEDVIHSFWVPKLVGKTDMMPNRHNKLDPFTPTEVGTFYGQCAEFCGSAHALMRFRVHVDTLADYQRWVSSYNTPPPVPKAGTAAARGQMLFGTCSGCHAISGTPYQGKIGPDLTLFGDRSTVGAGILPATEENVRQWVANVRSLKPIPEQDATNKQVMPTFYDEENPDKSSLSQQQINDIVAYLKTLVIQ